MNKIIYYAFVSLILFSCAAKKELVTPVAKDLEKPDVVKGIYYWIMKPRVFIRETNSVSSKKVDTLEDGDSVLVSLNQNGWYQVKTAENISGWIRSDLLGPKKLNTFIAAVNFAEQVKEEKKIDLFFDKKLFHKRIYISFPEQQYTSKAEVQSKAINIAQEYQNLVYRGDITVRVLKPGSEEEYLTFSQKGFPNSDLNLPILPFGRLESINFDNPEEIMIAVMISDEINNEILLNSAREISAGYPLSYKKVQLKYISEDGNCLLWFEENQNGEMFDFKQCPD
jgi:hypothetical protein